MKVDVQKPQGFKNKLINAAICLWCRHSWRELVDVMLTWSVVSGKSTKIDLE